MKKLLFIIFLMAFSFAITANAKKPKVVWPKAVLTLKDGTVLNGYLQNDIHFMKKYIYFSETQNGKDVKYKIVDIKSLEVDNALQDGKKRTFILIDEDPTFQYLATVIYKGKHVTGYMQPFAFENSTHSIYGQIIPFTWAVDHTTIRLMAESLFTIGCYLRIKKLIPKEKNILKRNC